MKTKNLMLMFAGVFALLLCAGMISAELTFEPTSITKTITAGETNSITIEFNLSASFIDHTINDWISTPTRGLWSFPSTGSTILLGTTETFTATLNNIPYDFIGTINADISVNSTSGAGVVQPLYPLPITITVEAPEYEACDLATSNASDLELSVDIKNQGTGKDTEWNLLDTIEVEAKLKNDRDSDGEDDYDLEDVIFKLHLIDENNKDVAEDMIWISEDENEFEFGDINEGKKGEHIFEFRINPEEIEEGNYLLAVSAYSDEDEDQCIGYSEDLDQIYYQKIEVQGESNKGKMVIVDADSLPKPLEASCEGILTIDADVWNIGDKDFEEQIKVRVYNKELGIDQEEVVEGDLDAGEKTEVSFQIEIPAGVEEKQYTLSFTTYYDYDEDDEEYDEVSDDSYDAYLKISGNCAVAKTDVSASLEQGGKAGESVVVKATIINSGSKTTAYTLNAAGYADWATSASLDKTQITLDAGESADVLITLATKKEASGDKIFNFEIVSGGELVASQPVQVSIEPRSALNLSNGGMASILIGAISIILVVIIIVLAVRVARK